MVGEEQANPRGFILMPDNLWDKSDMFELLLSVVSLLVTDYHKTWPPVSAWWQCGCRQPPATTHLLHCPLFLARFYSAAHTRPVCPSAHTDNFTIKHSHNRVQCWVFRPSAQPYINDWLLLAVAPQLDIQYCPSEMFSMTIHDTCQFFQLVV